MIIKHSAGNIGSVYDKEKKEWVKVKEPDTKEKPEPKKEEDEKEEEKK